MICSYVGNAIKNRERVYISSGNCNVLNTFSEDSCGQRVHTATLGSGCTGLRDPTVRGANGTLCSQFTLKPHVNPVFYPRLQSRLAPHKNHPFCLNHQERICLSRYFTPLDPPTHICGNSTTIIWKSHSNWIFQVYKLRSSKCVTHDHTATTGQSWDLAVGTRSRCASCLSPRPHLHPTGPVTTSSHR